MRRVGTPWNSRLIAVAVGLVIGAIFLWLSMRAVDIETLRQAFARADLGCAGLAALMGVLFLVVKTVRWQIILRPVVRCDYRLLECLVAVGISANLVIAHSGELVRAIGVTRHERVAGSAVLATIGVERVLDFVAVLLLLAPVLASAPEFAGPLASAAMVVAACVLIGVAVVILWLNGGPRRGQRSSVVLKYLPRRAVDWLARQLSQSRTGVEIARDPWVLTQVVLLSLVQWVFIAAAVWLSCMAVGVAATLGASVGVFALMIVGVTLPTAPGYLGTTQLAFVTGLAASGVPAEQAFASSLVYSVAVNLFLMLVGAVRWLSRCDAANQ